jgi:hypothetical protein
MIAKIQIARQQLQIDEDDYRQAVFDASGQMSLRVHRYPAAQHPRLDEEQGLSALPRARGATHPMAQSRALWISLYQLGVVHNAAEAALEAFAKRQLGCERLAWARQSDANRLIEALKSMGERAGWLQHDRCTGKRLEPLALQASLCSAILIKLKERGVVPQAWALHDAAWKLCGIENGRAAPWTATTTSAGEGAGRKLRAFGGPSGSGDAA